jgi:hypothetical protein
VRKGPEEPGSGRSIDRRSGRISFAAEVETSAQPSIGPRRALGSVRRGRTTAVVCLGDVETVRRLRLIDKDRRVRRAGRQHVERVDDQRHGAFVP